MRPEKSDDMSESRNSDFFSEFSGMFWRKKPDRILINEADPDNISNRYIKLIYRRRLWHARKRSIWSYLGFLATRI